MTRLILALARLVAKYKWQRDYCITGYTRPHYPEERAIADLDRLWEERH